MDMLHLGGDWRVSHLPTGDPIGNRMNMDADTTGWLTAHIPEDIHETLRRYGYITGFHYGRDEQEEKWIEDRDWVYQREFFFGEIVCDRPWILKFDGLDTFCCVYLNGRLILQGNNMHITYEADVSSVLRANARNVLVVRFFSASHAVEDISNDKLYSTTTLDRIKARKAQMNYSWDFCGRCLSLGIWRDVTLYERPAFALINPYFYTEHITEDGNAADVAVKVAIRTDQQLPGDASLLVQLGDEPSVIIPMNDLHPTQGGYDACAHIRIEQPRLWWPRPYGAQERYSLELTLQAQDHTLCSLQQQVGIRTVHVCMEPQEDGMSFYISVNNRRLFIRGANWVPASVIYTEIDETRYRSLLEYAVKGNLSMLRIWGGGIYEPNVFYDLCDELGILLSHDFMIACGVFPQNDSFCASIREEAAQNVLRLRNHPSIAMWAGDNENDCAYEWDGRRYDFTLDRLNRHVLKEVCAELDPHRFFADSSPYSPFVEKRGGDNPNSPYQGDMHMYMTDTEPSSRSYYKKIRTARPRFVSEFGFFCLPERQSYEEFNYYSKDLELFDHLHKAFHNVDEYTNGQVCAEDLIYYSQQYNAYALKYWIEYFRSLKWTCAGSLYWKYNDPTADREPKMLFPSMMSTVDMYGRPKMTYFYTKRSYNDLILTFQEEERLTVYAVSELQKDLQGQLTLQHLDFFGNVLWEVQQSVVIAADASSPLYRFDIPIESLLTQQDDSLCQYLLAELVYADGQRVLDRYFFVDIPKFTKLRLPPAQLVLKASMLDEQHIQINVSSSVYARNIMLSIPGRDIVYFEDNYFDIDAGQCRNFTLTLKEGHNLAALRECIVCACAERGERATIELYQVIGGDI